MLRTSYATVQKLSENNTSCSLIINAVMSTHASNQIKSHYLLLRFSSVAQRRQVQAYNYQIWNNTMPINNKYKKLKTHNAVKMSIVQASFEIR